MKINLGSGNSKLEGYTNIDIYPFNNVHIVHDIEKKLPIKNNTVEEIYSSHALEHCKKDSIPGIFSECSRIAKKNCIMKIVVPCLECCMKNFLEKNENERWGKPIEYIFGSQGRGQSGQQYHKTGFTPEYLKRIVNDAGFLVTELIEKHDGFNNCIHLTAYKL